jgi:hypoxanthine phosphoribosyltransferase
MDMKINYQQLHGHILELTRQIYNDSWRPDYIVGINPSGLFPSLLISQYMQTPLYTLKVSIENNLEYDCDHNAWMAEDAFGYQSQFVESGNNNQKNILIVDSINNQGDVISWIRNDWMQSCLPNDNKWKTVWGNNVRTAVVVNNICSSVEVDYCSLDINLLENPVEIVFPTENWWKT